MHITNTCLTTGTGQIFCSSTTRTLVFYRNGKEVSYLLGEEIRPNDNVIIYYGVKTESQDVLGAATHSAEIRF